MKAPRPATKGAFLALLAFLGWMVSAAQAQSPAGPDSVKPKPRGFRTFLPKSGDKIDDPASQVVQVLLDRQDKGGFDSYMVQVLFRGKPAERAVRTLDDRIEIDFLDTGKPSMRLARIRGGAVEASSLDELFYRDGPGKTRIKHLVRLTLFMRARPEMRFRDTLDRTLIHFRIDKPDPGPK